MMNTFARIFLLSLFFALSSAFNLSTPDLPSVGQPFNSQYNTSKSDYEGSTTGFIGVVLIAPAIIPCPKGLGEVGFDPKTVVDGYAFVEKPEKQGFLSRNLTFQPEKTGIHILCAYANAPKNTKGRKGLDLGDLSLVSETPPFNVTGLANQKPSTTTSQPTATSSSTAMGDNSWWRNKNRNHNKPDIAPIVGGVVGGVALICILIAVFFYRRFRYQKKLNQFHKEHQLLHQTPPPSILASTLTSPNRYPVYCPSSPPTDLRSPGSPTTIRPASHIPLGFDETMQKSYHFPSVGSSPSSYSVPLPHEPALRAQHGPAMGASNVC
ncbi:hypothetical protein AAF712_014254 [Marasmius tenuissimus]|uniref:Uncharacterized protein n=1 Tax=Marasmius tenuissimus TaxID=585030 RepID=A0ABR2ZBI9_9AGAR